MSGTRAQTAGHTYRLTSQYLTSKFITMPTDPRPPSRSSLGLVILMQLHQEPMHVYRMQKLLEATGKDRQVNVRARASLYQAIERLRRHGLVEAVETVRGDGYPDRVVYGITEAGREVAMDWLREMLHTTGAEFPEFTVALSVLFTLAPDDACAELEQRAERLAAELADSERQFTGAPPELPKLFLLEEDYRRTLLAAELGWVNGVIEDLRSGRLTWSEEWLRELASQFLPGPGEETK
jgi:DNA-binding PadR family transcriptional regulator